MYASAQDMLDRFGTPKLVQLTDINVPMTGTVNATVLSKALADASSVIDGYLVGRYPLPLANPPEVLKVHCCTLAHFRLLGSSADDAAIDANKEALGYLAKVAEGKVSLIAPADVPAAVGAGPVLFNPGSKVMGRESDDADPYRGRW